MVEKVYTALPKDINISVHCHNDLGMATAATVESYFKGAVQLETALNGLGERAGNTNFYEVAVALHNSGVDVPVDLSRIYETALIIEEMSKVRIYEKAPLIGHIVKSQPWSAVVGVDDTAADESELEQDVLHYVVVGVGVGPKVKAMGSSPTEAFQSHASLNT